MKTRLQKNKRIAAVILLFTFASITFGFFVGCQPPRPKIRIAISKGIGSEHYEKYGQWLRQYDASIECIDLYNVNSSEVDKLLESCSGLLLSGGPDVHPYYYAATNDSARCEIDMKRDSLEFEIIKKAISLKLPILGICRGLQILNVAFGGSLIVDIPKDYDSLIAHRCPNPDSCWHDVRIDKSSLLYSICKIETGIANTNHHQAIKVLSDSFRVSALANDGIIEAIEWKNPDSKPFLIAVQWHPERMAIDNLLSMPIIMSFLNEVNKNMKQPNF